MLALATCSLRLRIFCSTPAEFSSMVAWNACGPNGSVKYPGTEGTASACCLLHVCVKQKGVVVVTELFIL